MESGGRTDEEGVDVYEPFELQPSVLEVVARLCPQHEAEEIWRVVGHSLVEQARDLLEEAKSHVEIWRQLKEESDNSVSRDVSSALPEPPMVRERLIQEIRFLAHHLRSKASSPVDLHVGTNRRSREILEYALMATSENHGRCGSGCGRPLSAASSRDGRDTPLRRSTPSSLEGSQSSVLSSGVSVGQVSLADIDSTVHYLREVLEEEISQRRGDIVFLQECCERESAHLETQATPPPSLRELREVGTRLEREVMSVTNRGNPSVAPSSPSSVVLPRPPPGLCPGRSLMSSTSVRRASGIKPHSTPDGITSHNTHSLSPDHNSVESVAFPRLSHHRILTAHSKPIT